MPALFHAGTEAVRARGNAFGRVPRDAGTGHDDDSAFDHLDRTIMHLLRILAAALFALVAGQAGARDYPVATRAMAAAGAEPFPMTLWYPASAAGESATPAPGRFPLLLFSHGSGGSERNQRGWAAHLASKGYVVLAPRHWGDSYDKPRGRGTDVQLVRRPQQAAEALDTVLADPFISASIDAARIGMLGYSAGGYTTLVMAGGRPDFSLWRAHCKAHASEDDEFCPAFVWRFLPLITHPAWQLPRETRIKAAVVMAPAAVLFDRAGLAGIHIPLRVYAARDDRHVQNQWSAAKVAASLPSPVTLQQVPGGHYIFLTPCTAQLLAEAPHLCIDAPGVDRAAIHRQIADDLVAFFDANL
jgi:predicted dienelactone hydrolase